jgi:hypothetical protein
VGQDVREPIIYLPYRQQPMRGINVIARTTVPPGTLGDSFRRSVQDLDQDLPVFNLNTLDAFLAQRNWPRRVFGTMFGIFAAIARNASFLFGTDENVSFQRWEEDGQSDPRVFLLPSYMDVPVNQENHWPLVERLRIHPSGGV